MELYAFERRRWLVDQARQVGRIDVAEVARTLTVARETVRRDLSVLETEGLLRRVHGGAVPVERLGFEGTLSLRESSHQDEKAQVADCALRRIGAAELIYLDEGSTTAAFAERLHPSRAMTVVTNALPIALLLTPRENVTVVLIGGRVRGEALGAIDHWALRMIDDFVFDVCLLGANGVTAQRGLTCADPAVAAVKARAAGNSRRTLLIADGSKFGTDSSYKFAELRQVSTIITGRSANEAMVQRIRGLGVETVVV